MPKIDLLTENDGGFDLVLDDTVVSDIGIAVVEEGEEIPAEMKLDMERLKRLAHFVAQLRAADAADGVKFGKLVAIGVDILELTTKDIAHEFACSLPTVDRWINGVNAPHPAMRPAIYDWFERQALLATEDCGV